MLVNPKQYYLARLILESLLWNEWADLSYPMDILEEDDYLSVCTRNFEVYYIDPNNPPPCWGGVVNFRLLDRHQRVQVWTLILLKSCYPDMDLPKGAIFDSTLYASFMILLSQIDDEIIFEIDQIQSSQKQPRAKYWFVYRQFVFDAFLGIRPSFFEDFDVSGLDIDIKDFRKILLISEGKTKENSYFFKYPSSPLDREDKLCELYCDGLIPYKERLKLIEKYYDLPYRVNDKKFHHWYWLIDNLMNEFFEDMDFTFKEGTMLINPETNRPTLPEDFFHLCRKLKINYDFFMISSHLTYCLPYEESLAISALLIMEIINNKGQAVSSLEEIKEKAKLLQIQHNTPLVDLLISHFPKKDLKVLNKLAITTYKQFA